MTNFFQTTKASTAAIFLYMVGMAFGAIVGYEILLRQPIDPIALSFLYGTITYAVNSAGTKAGVDHTNSTVEHVAIAQYPMTPNGISSVKAEAANIAAQQAVEDQKAAGLSSQGVNP